MASAPEEIVKHGGGNKTHQKTQQTEQKSFNDFHIINANNQV
jgi:hypothetical protein